MTRYNEAPEKLSKTFGYKLSILLPSAYPEKRERFIQNLKETLSDFNSVEIVICLDGHGPNHREKNIVTTYSPPSKARGTFFNAAWKASTGRFLLMANDDIVFKTKNWDQLIPYDNYPDDLVLFYFKDNRFNEGFSCHPIWSRRVMEYEKGLFDPPYQITKCDNTIWDIHPPNRRIYIPEIEIDHIQTPYGSEWIPIYEQDNKLYIEHVDERNRVKNWIMEQTNVGQSKVMIGVVTAEFARRADFYDYFNIIEKPSNSICINVHGQSIANNRNKIVEQALIYNCTHIFFIDDDVICQPNVLFKLLQHDKDVVTALQLKRNFPHIPLIFGPQIDEITFPHIQLHELGSGLRRIYGAGLGAILIKTDVFRKLESPYFRLGELRRDELGEDLGFFKRINKLGIESYCDLDCTVGHISSAVVRPIRKENIWIVDYDTNGDGTIAFVPKPIEELEAV